MSCQFVREPLTSEEADRLCHACQSIEEKMIVWILLDTGLRVSELCSLTPQHILWQEKSLRITGKGSPHGQKSKKRVIPMSKRVQALLEPYFSLHEEWFMGTRQIQKIVKKIANRAQISRPVTPHILRHTFATLALQKGLSLATVKKILGHEQLATTAIYLNLTDTHVAEEFDKKW